eukprot:CAMPEP_0177678110 /NCGR_PEP_ID=MMETSP0447-20121125/28823_1 /TAXON_ID=0 /ORGANISM="Stygamoeba regulata, Strain BSH-02190019" /LENGTH=179 /DNA_ID=CAMNT_0019187069 /DNA_START=105 /DNA_END=645 /DNA_ORIENTATION=-
MGKSRPASSPGGSPDAGSPATHHQPDRPPPYKVSHMNRKEGLEDSTLRIVKLLQRRGRLVFKEIHRDLAIDYRRAYDILNVLLDNPPGVQAGQAAREQIALLYQDGVPLSEPVDVCTIMDQIRQEQAMIEASRARINYLIAALNAPAAQKPNPFKLFEQFMQDDKLPGAHIYNNMFLPS